MKMMKRETYITNAEKKIQESMDSKNIKKDEFELLELENYGFDESEIKLILEYQHRLPILQENNERWIDARILWGQLRVNRDFTDWIKQQIRDVYLEKHVDYDFSTSIGKTHNPFGRHTSEYKIKIQTAKEIAMIVGIKGGCTSDKLKELSRIAHKYFILIEDAYKFRNEWNYDRANTLVQFAGLKQTLLEYKSELLKYIPNWANNLAVAEFRAINSVVIGMTAKEFRALKGLKKRESIRNAFTEQQLEDVAELERFDSDLISVLHIFDYDKRRKLMMSKYRKSVGLK